MVRTSAFLLLVLFAPCGRCAEPDARDPAFKAWLQHYSSAAALEDFRLSSAPNERLEMTPDPVLSYSHPSGLKGTHGAFYVWTKKGRPQVIGSIWSFEKPNGRRGVNHELHSLATEPLAPTMIGTSRWSPQTGIEPRHIPDAPEPANTSRLRLAQMRALAKRFQGFSNTVENQEGRLRTLPQPLYRSEPVDPEVLDCGLFGLFADWDPEILLLIEARRTDSGYRWHFSAGRFNACRMRMTFDDVEVWKKDEEPQAYPTFGDPEGLFFAVHDVEVIDAPPSKPFP